MNASKHSEEFSEIMNENVLDTDLDAIEGFNKISISSNSNRLSLKINEKQLYL